MPANLVMVTSSTGLYEMSVPYQLDLIPFDLSCFFDLLTAFPVREPHLLVGAICLGVPSSGRVCIDLFSLSTYF